MAQRRISEADVELDRRINGLIKLKEKTTDDLEN